MNERTIFFWCQTQNFSFSSRRLHLSKFPSPLSSCFSLWNLCPDIFSDWSWQYDTPDSSIYQRIGARRSVLPVCACGLKRNVSSILPLVFSPAWFNAITSGVRQLLSYVYEPSPTVSPPLSDNHAARPWTWAARCRKTWVPKARRVILYQILKIIDQLISISSQFFH